MYQVIAYIVGYDGSDMRFVYYTGSRTNDLVRPSNALLTLLVCNVLLLPNMVGWLVLLALCNLGLNGSRVSKGILQLRSLANRLDICVFLFLLKTCRCLFRRLQQSTPLIMLCIPTGIRNVIRLEWIVTLEVDGRGAAIIISLVPGRVRVMETVTLLAFGVKLSSSMLGLFYYMLERNRLRECRNCGFC